MGAQPKKKSSKSKRDQRRGHDAVHVGAIVLCSHCRRPHISHRVCPNCGYYNGREVVPDKPERTTE